MCYPYIFTNYNNTPTLAHTYLIYLIFIDSLHLSLINHINAYTLLSYKHPNASNNINLTI